MTGACDTHVHVFEPARFPYREDRTYTPGPASAGALLRFQGDLGLDRVVLVQPSVYGTDNAALLDALAQLGPARARGIAVVDDPGPGKNTLRALHAAGVRGIRLNIEVASDYPAARLRERLQALTWLKAQAGWCLQLHASLPLTLALLDDLAALGVPVVLDHFAGIHKQDRHALPALASLHEFLRTGPGWIKLSAPYRCHSSWREAEVLALAQSLATTAPERVLWGSDWPHTGGEAGKPRDPSRIEPFRMIDNAAGLRALRATLGEAGSRQMLVANPGRLYGFAASE